MLPWLKITKYNDAEDDTNDHDQVKGDLVTGKLFIFSPEGVFFFLLWHEGAKLVFFVLGEWLIGLIRWAVFKIGGLIQHHTMNQNLDTWY